MRCMIGALSFISISLTNSLNGKIIYCPHFIG
jgi:hypothetical protein